MLFTKKKYGQIEKELPTIVKTELNKLDESARSAFTEEYLKKRRATDWCYVLVFIFLLHRLYLKQPLMFVLQWVSVFLVIGLVWVVIDLLLIPSMVKKRNGEIAKEILMEQKAITSS